METNHSEVVRKMDKQALLVYSSLAGVVYSCALAYCYFTNHFFEMGIVGAVMLGLGILIVNVYLSINAESKKHEIGNSYEHAA
jgi:hypothetical protein